MITNISVLGRAKTCKIAVSLGARILGTGRPQGPVIPVPPTPLLKLGRLAGHLHRPSQTSGRIQSTRGAGADGWSRVTVLKVWRGKTRAGKVTTPQYCFQDLLTKSGMTDRLLGNNGTWNKESRYSSWENRSGEGPTAPAEVAAIAYRGIMLTDRTTRRVQESAAKSPPVRKMADNNNIGWQSMSQWSTEIPLCTMGGSALPDQAVWRNHNVHCAGRLMYSFPSCAVRVRPALLTTSGDPPYSLACIPLPGFCTSLDPNSPHGAGERTQPSTPHTHTVFSLHHLPTLTSTPPLHDSKFCPDAASVLIPSTVVHFSTPPPSHRYFSL